MAPSSGVSIAVGLVAALSLGAGRAAGPPLRAGVGGHAGSVLSRSSATQTAITTCPQGTLPDGSACVRTPGEDAPSAWDSEASAHHDKRGRWVAYDQIARRPERPADYDAYSYPVACSKNCVLSGYDLDMPDDEQRRGRRLSQVGHGGVDLAQKRGALIHSLALDHQEGDAEVVYVGPLFGSTVVTRHTLRDAGRLRDYVLVFGHLEAAAPGVVRGSRLRPGDLLGFVGDTGSRELVHLHLEVRRAREGVDVANLTPEGLVSGENTVVCDPRNVLPLR